MKFTKRFIYFTALLAVQGCGTKIKKDIDRPEDVMYKEATTIFKNRQYERAADLFDETDRKYPCSKTSINCQLYSAYCCYKAKKFQRAIQTLEVFIAIYPSSSLLMYAYYLRAACYYAQIQPLERDRENTFLAMYALNVLLERFPNGVYQKEALEKLDLILEHLASQEILNARNYMNRKVFIPALFCLNRLLKQFPKSRFLPEALYRIAECKIALGLGKTCAVESAILQNSYGKTPWSSQMKRLLASQRL